MVKDMTSCLPLYKYVDDSTLSEIIQKGQETRLLQQTFDQIVEWTKENGMTINPTKTHDMVMSGAKPGIAPKITIDGQELERVSSTKIVGVYVQSYLKWDTHVDYIVSGAQPKLFFLTQLNSSQPNYKTIVRSKLDYAAPVYSTSLPSYLRDRLEVIQKQAMTIIFPNFTYKEALIAPDIETLEQRRYDISKTF